MIKTSVEKRVFELTTRKAQAELDRRCLNSLIGDESLWYFKNLAVFVIQVSVL